MHSCSSSYGYMIIKYNLVTPHNPLCVSSFKFTLSNLRLVFLLKVKHRFFVLVGAAISFFSAKIWKLIRIALSLEGLEGLKLAENLKKLEGLNLKPAENLKNTYPKYCYLF